MCTPPRPHIICVEHRVAKAPTFSPARNFSRVPMPSRGRNLVAVPLTVPLQSCRHHVWCGLEVFTWQLAELLKA
jgi:hypothetical protein